MEVDLNESDSLTQSLIAAGGFDFAKDVIAELRLGWRRDAVEAQMRQQRLAAASERLGLASARGVDGLGQLTHRIDTGAYLHWAICEPGCWNDKGFWNQYARDNPEVRVAYARKAMVTHPGLLKVEGKRESGQKGGLLAA